MNNPQFWGAVRGVLIALGGAVAGFGLMSAAEWTEMVDQAMAVAMAVAGLVAIVWPMVQGWRARSREGLIRQTAEVLKPSERIVLADPGEADAIPSRNVVSG